MITLEAFVGSSTLDHLVGSFASTRTNQTSGSKPKRPGVPDPRQRPEVPSSNPTNRIAGVIDAALNATAPAPEPVSGLKGARRA